MGFGLLPLACWYRGLESFRGHGGLFVVSAVCFQVEVSVSGWSLVQRSPTECGVSEYDHEASIMRRPWSTGGCFSMECKFENFVVVESVIINLVSLFYLSVDVALFKCHQVCWPLFVMCTGAIISAMWPMAIVILVFKYFKGLRMTT